MIPFHKPNQRPLTREENARILKLLAWLAVSVLVVYTTISYFVFGHF